MLTTPYTTIFSKASLHEALRLIKSKSSGLDKESLLAFKKSAKVEIEELFEELRSGKYAPQPIEKIAIAKNKTEKRPIASNLSSTEYHSHNFTRFFIGNVTFLQD